MGPTRALIALAAWAVSVAGAAGLTGCSAPGATPAEKRTRILDLRDRTVAELHRRAPEARAKMDRAAGYGVFSSVGTKLVFVAGGGGFGVVTDTETGDNTFMRMGGAGLGFGLGVKDFRAVFIFHDRGTLRRFVTSGWAFGAEVDAAAKSGDKGVAGTAADTLGSGMDVYQFTDSGLIAGITVSGTRYWPDAELNDGGGD